MTVKRLFVLAILGGVLSRSAASTCGPEEFQCGSGECIGKELRCTHPDYYFLQKIPDCADWSNIDPGLCSSFPTINLRVGEQVSAVIWYTKELRHMTTGLMFFLCDGLQNCGFMDITDVTDPGLHYMACASGDVIGSCADSGVRRGAGTHRFSDIPEIVEIVAERSADKLTVWWKMGPEQRAWTFVPANASSLMIRPSTWFRDIEVTWGDVTECRGPNDFRCANGECVTIFDRCQSGRIYCADGSDRDPEYCSAFPSASLEVGQRRLVTVQWGADNSYTNVMFVMCDGPMNCGAIATMGSTPSGALFYKARHRCTVFWSQQDAGREVWPNGTIFFPREMDKLVFEVELRAGNLTVSLPGASTHPGAWVTVPAGATSLMVRPGTWYQDMAVEWGEPLSP